MNDMSEREPDETTRLQRMLEEATADRTHPTSQDEGVELRATWLAFGRLLNAADEAQPTQARSASEWTQLIQARSASEGARSIEARSASEGTASIPRSLAESIDAHVSNERRKVRRIRTWVAIATAVAAVCIVFAEVVNIGLNNWRGLVDWQIKHNASVVQQAPPQPPAPAVVHNDIPTPLKKTNLQKPAAGAAKESIWDDAIETQITSVSQQIESVRQDWRHRVDDVDLVQYRIDEVSAGLTNNAL
jgi:hypothetical protein